ECPKACGPQAILRAGFSNRVLAALRQSGGVMMRMFARVLAVAGTAMIAGAPGAYAAAAGGGAPTGSPTGSATGSAPSASAPAVSNDRLFYALGVILSRNQNLAALDL